MLLTAVRCRPASPAQALAKHLAARHRERESRLQAHAGSAHGAAAAAAAASHGSLALRLDLCKPQRAADGDADGHSRHAADTATAAQRRRLHARFQDTEDGLNDQQDTDDAEDALGGASPGGDRQSGLLSRRQSGAAAPPWERRPSGHADSRASSRPTTAGLLRARQSVGSVASRASSLLASQDSGGSSLGEQLARHAHVLDLARGLAGAGAKAGPCRVSGSGAQASLSFAELVERFLNPPSAGRGDEEEEDDGPGGADGAAARQRRTAGPSAGVSFAAGVEEDGGGEEEGAAVLSSNASLPVSKLLASVRSFAAAQQWKERSLQGRRSGAAPLAAADAPSSAAGGLAAGPQASVVCVRLDALLDGAEAGGRAAGGAAAAAGTGAETSRGGEQQQQLRSLRTAASRKVAVQAGSPPPQQSHTGASSEAGYASRPYSASAAPLDDNSQRVDLSSGAAGLWGDDIVGDDDREQPALPHHPFARRGGPPADDAEGGGAAGQPAPPPAPERPGVLLDARASRDPGSLAMSGRQKQQRQGAAGEPPAAYPAPPPLLRTPIGFRGEDESALDGEEEEPWPQQAGGTAALLLRLADLAPAAVQHLLHHGAAHPGGPGKRQALSLPVLHHQWAAGEEGRMAQVLEGLHAMEAALDVDGAAPAQAPRGRQVRAQQLAAAAAAVSTAQPHSSTQGSSDGGAAPLAPATISNTPEVQQQQQRPPGVPRLALGARLAPSEIWYPQARCEAMEASRAAAMAKPSPSPFAPLSPRAPLPSPLVSPRTPRPNLAGAGVASPAATPRRLPPSPRAAMLPCGRRETPPAPPPAASPRPPVLAPAAAAGPAATAHPSPRPSLASPRGAPAQQPPAEPAAASQASQQQWRPQQLASQALNLASQLAGASPLGQPVPPALVAELLRACCPTFPRPMCERMDALERLLLTQQQQQQQQQRRQQRGHGAPGSGTVSRETSSLVPSNAAMTPQASWDSSAAFRSPRGPRGAEAAAVQRVGASGHRGAAKGGGGGGGPSHEGSEPWGKQAVAAASAVGSLAALDAESSSSSFGFLAPGGDGDVAAVVAGGGGAGGALSARHPSEKGAASRQGLGRHSRSSTGASPWRVLRPSSQLSAWQLAVGGCSEEGSVHLLPWHPCLPAPLSATPTL